MIGNYYQTLFTGEKHKLERSESETHNRSFEVQRNIILILSLAILWNLDLNKLPFFSKILMSVALKCWQLYIAIDNIPKSKWQCQWEEILVNGDMHLLFKERGKKGWLLLLRHCLLHLDLWSFFVANRVIVSSIRYCDCWSDWLFLTNSAFLYWIKPACKPGPNPLRCSRHCIASFARKNYAISHKSGTYGGETKVLNYNIAMPNFLYLICSEHFIYLGKSNPMHNEKDLKIWVETKQ